MNVRNKYYTYIYLGKLHIYIIYKVIDTNCSSCEDLNNIVSNLGSYWWLIDIKYQRIAECLMFKK